MDRRRIILWGVLAIAVIFTVSTSSVTKSLFGPRTPVAARPPAAPPGATLSESELAAWRRSHGDAWKRDPFFTAAEERRLADPSLPAPAPVAAAADSAPPSYSVKLVMISGALKVAEIDGRLVSEGEMVGEERVAQIHADGVVLERAGRRRTIEVAAPAALPLIEIERRGAAEGPRR